MKHQSIIVAPAQAGNHGAARQRTDRWIPDHVRDDSIYFSAVPAHPSPPSSPPCAGIQSHKETISLPPRMPGQAGHNGERGNALFLILIAVALFAALSYAITQSSRGGGSIDREQAEIFAGQIMGEVARIRTAIQRLELIGGYDQVLFSDDPANEGGTCYHGNTAITPCKIIGLFGPDAAVEPPLWRPEFRDPAYPAATTSNWRWQSRQILVNGLDLGTSEPDINIQIGPVRPAICEAINRAMLDDPAVGAHAPVAGSGHGYTQYYFRDDGTLSGPGSGADSVDVTNLGCTLSPSGRYVAMFIVETF